MHSNFAPSNRNKLLFFFSFDVDGVTGRKNQKASLSANAPVCVAVWSWEALADYVQRTAPLLTSGKAPGPGG